MSPDRIVLSVPARGEYARTIRLVAGSIAGRMGLSYEAVADAQAACEEAFIFAVDEATPEDVIAFEFVVEDALLVVEMTMPYSGAPGGALNGTITDLFLNEMCDQHTFIATAPGRATLRLETRCDLVDAD